MRLPSKPGISRLFFCLRSLATFSIQNGYFCLGYWELYSLNQQVARVQASTLLVFSERLALN